MPLHAPVLAFPQPSGVPSGYYLLASNVAAAASTALSTLQVNSLMPFNVPKPIRFDRISLSLVTPQTGAECRLGIYADNNGTPFGGALILDAGTMDLSTGGGTLREAAIDITLPAGRYWTMCMNKAVATGATVVRVSNVLGCAVVQNNNNTWGIVRAYTVTMTYGALDAICPVGTADGNGFFPLIGLRAA